MLAAQREKTITLPHILSAQNKVTVTNNWKFGYRNQCGLAWEQKKRFAIEEHF